MHRLLTQPALTGHNGGIPAQMHRMTRIRSRRITSIGDISMLAGDLVNLFGGTKADIAILFQSPLVDLLRWNQPSHQTDLACLTILLDA